MSYTCLRYHITYSTKERRTWISPELLPRICEYMGGMIRQVKGHPILINGPEDHLHVVCSIPPTITVADFIRDLKSNCTSWIHDTFPDLRDFCWQDGYAAFTVSPTVLPRLLNYVLAQQEHHKKVSFRDELIWLLKNHGIGFDERYLL